MRGGQLNVNGWVKKDGPRAAKNCITSHIKIGGYLLIRSYSPSEDNALGQLSVVPEGVRCSAVGDVHMFRSSPRDRP